MTRGLAAANAEASASDRVNLAMFFEGDFVGGTVRVWSGAYNIAWGGNTWTGAGSLMAVSSIEETADVVASGITASLSGVPMDMISVAISSARQGAAGRLYIGFLNDDGTLKATPELLFAGLLDVPSIAEDGETVTVSISYENQLIDLQRAREWRYTHESQQQFFKGDLGFEYVTSIQDMDLKWGR